MKELVEVRGKEIFADSHLVARKFGMQHKDFINTADRVIEKIGKLRGDAVLLALQKKLGIIVVQILTFTS